MEELKFLFVVFLFFIGLWPVAIILGGYFTLSLIFEIGARQARERLRIQEEDKQEIINKLSFTFDIYDKWDDIDPDVAKALEDLAGAWDLNIDKEKRIISRNH